jgi:hypothetical protein
MATSQPKKVIVLGGDGFCGWPTYAHRLPARAPRPHRALVATAEPLPPAARRCDSACARESGGAGAHARDVGRGTLAGRCTWQTRATTW